MIRHLGFSTLAVVVMMTSSAQAAMLTAGSIGFRATTITASPGDNILSANAVFTFETATGGINSQTTNGGPTGVFMPIPENTVIISSTLDLGAAGGTGDPYLTLTLGTSSFIATSLFGDTMGINSRIINLTGFITGTGFDDTPADFTLVFSQTSGAGNAIGYGGTLAVTSAVPEPASVGLMGMGLIGVIFVARRRLGLRAKLAA